MVCWVPLSITLRDFEQRTIDLLKEENLNFHKYLANLTGHTLKQNYGTQT